MTEAIALTGASGFIGRPLAGALLNAGWRVRALLRRPDPALQAAGIEPVFGTLDDAAALRQLVDGTAAVVHAAGLIKGARDRDFFCVNAEGTARLLDQVLASQRPARVLLISSLAARVPELSAYAASKRAAERELQKPGRLLTYAIVRPPAVYGPDDRATLPLLRLLSRQIALVPAPAEARFSLLFVDDLVSFVLLLLQQEKWHGNIFEPDDAREQGYRWSDLIKAIRDHLRKPIRAVFVPKSALMLAVAGGGFGAGLLGMAPPLSRGKLRELFWDDWLSSRETLHPIAGWQPQVQFEEGFARTWLGYQEHGWI